MQDETVEMPDEKVKMSDETVEMPDEKVKKKKTGARPPPSRSTR